MIGVSKFSLGRDVCDAIAEAKSRFKFGTLPHYNGHELLSTTAGRRGAYFLEHHVGQAHPGDNRPVGKRRLVLLIQSERIEEMYFSDAHYGPGSWTRIMDF